MFKIKNKNTSQEIKLYNKIVLLSRNKFFYSKVHLNDTFQNRIYLIFIHFSFLLIEMKKNTNDSIYKNFNQNIFDIIFREIELNMREIGYGDTVVNSRMKYLVKTFYAILLESENYDKKTFKNKIKYLTEYLATFSDKISSDNEFLVDYFDKFQSFCFDLSSESVLSGDLNFTYK